MFCVKDSNQLLYFRAHAAERYSAVDSVTTTQKRTRSTESNWKSSSVQSATHVRKSRPTVKNVAFASVITLASSATSSTMMTRNNITATLAESVELEGKIDSSTAKCAICVCRFNCRPKAIVVSRTSVDRTAPCASKTFTIAGFRGRLIAILLSHC